MPTLLDAKVVEKRIKVTCLTDLLMRKGGLTGAKTSRIIERLSRATGRMVPNDDSSPSSCAENNVSYGSRCEGIECRIVVQSSVDKASEPVVLNLSRNHVEVNGEGNSQCPHTHHSQCHAEE